MKENYFSLLIDSPTENITIIIDEILFGGNQKILPLPIISGGKCW